MPIDFENLNPSTKFPYPLCKDDEQVGDEWVKIRSLSIEKLKQIDKETIELKNEFVQPKKSNGKINQRAALQRVEYSEVTKPELRNELMWDEIIDEIHVFDTEGKLISSTTEVKMKLMKSSAAFATYIAECLELLMDDEKEEKRELEKNFTSSQSE